MVYCFQTSGAQPVAVPQILNWMGSEEKMVFVCDHCHFELEAGGGRHTGPHGGQRRVLPSGRGAGAACLSVGTNGLKRATLVR